MARQWQSPKYKQSNILTVLELPRMLIITYQWTKLCVDIIGPQYYGGVMADGRTGET